MKQNKVTFHIDVEEIDRPQYKNFFQKESPIFLVGDKIRGNLTLFLQSGSSLKHKGISISFQVKLYNNLKEVATKTFETHELVPSGILTETYSANFSFDIGSYSSSYIGPKYTYVYLIQASVKTFFSQIVENKHILILNPLQFYVTDQLPFFSIKNELLEATFLLKNTFVPNMGMIQGLFEVQNVLTDDIDSVESIYFQFINTETYKDHTSYSLLLNYQITEFLPKQSSKFPILIDISQMKLWQPPVQYDFSFQANYCVRFVCKLTNGKEIVSEDNNIPIIQTVFN